MIKWIKVSSLYDPLSFFNDPLTFDDWVDHPMPTGGLSHSKEREREPSGAHLFPSLSNFPLKGENLERERESNIPMFSPSPF